MDVLVILHEGKKNYLRTTFGENAPKAVTWKKKLMIENSKTDFSKFSREFGR
jgi:hypothetical protein